MTSQVCRYPTSRIIMPGLEITRKTDVQLLLPLLRNFFSFSLFFHLSGSQYIVEVIYIKCLTLNLLNFQNGIIHRTFFGTAHYHLKGYQDDNLKLVSQQYRACRLHGCALTLTLLELGRLQIRAV